MNRTFYTYLNTRPRVLLSFFVILAFGASSFKYKATAEWNEAWSTLPVFEEKYYERINSDFSQTKLSALEHWKKVGIDEGRSSSAVFDVKYYLAKNPDLAKKIGSKNYREATNHWLNLGIKKGLSSHPNFNVRFYAENNKDLQRVYSNNYEKLILHYLKTGINENRPTAPTPASANSYR
jgi:hypothetical protein